jgi:ferric-dicitrate binding protein FerR (iron transport regulator)
MNGMNDKAKTGGAYLRAESVEENRIERSKRDEQRAMDKRRAMSRRAMYALALAAGAGGLIYMVLNSLIDMKIGVFLLAAVSAVCGRGTA